MLRTVLFLIAGVSLYSDLDNQTKLLLPSLNQSHLSLEQMALEELRRSSPCETLPAKGVARINNVAITGSNGSFGIRIYTPAAQGPYPVFLFFHGGGWVAGSLDDYDSLCQEICRRANCLVVSVDYHLAPEYPFPKPLEDCYFAAQWVEGHIAEYQGNPEKIAVGGDSAGGNLTAAVTLKARENRNPKFIYQVLLCPAMNCNFETPSYYEFSEGYFLTREDMKFFWNRYLQSADPKDVYASPLRAPSLAGLPPACILVAEFDPLRDDALMYGRRLKEDGVAATIKRYRSIHGFYSFEQLSVGREAISFLIKCLEEKFKE